MSSAKAYIPFRSFSAALNYPITRQGIARHLLLLIHDFWWRTEQFAEVLRARDHRFYRMDLSEPLAREPVLHGTFIMSRSPRDIFTHFKLWRRHFGWPGAIKNSVKVISGSQVFYGVLLRGKLIQMGWATKGFCRYYRLEADAIVLESLWTNPAHRGKGYAPAALREAIAILSHAGCRRFYIDTTAKNVASQRMIAKAGFTRIPNRKVEKISAA